MKVKQKAVIKFLRLEGHTFDQIHQLLRNMYGNEAYSHAIVFNWVHEIDQGREDLEDAKRLGKSSLFQIDSMLLELLCKFSFYNTCTLVKAVGIFHTTVIHRLNRLDFQYQIICWILHLLSEDQKCQRINICKQFLPILKRDQ
jgi:hypothetical protein